MLQLLTCILNNLDTYYLFLPRIKEKLILLLVEYKNLVLKPTVFVMTLIGHVCLCYTLADKVLNVVVYYLWNTNSSLLDGLLW